ncbi:hypothetical protein, partial [Mesorhizobium sp.]|uniref:hypothetical protein n=1 Tax=Mesorhizobium sp. TaxID=1871066 RepID=UPI0025FC78A3
RRSAISIVFTAIVSIPSELVQRLALWHRQFHTVIASRNGIRCKPTLEPAISTTLIAKVTQRITSASDTRRGGDPSQQCLTASGVTAAGTFGHAVEDQV